MILDPPGQQNELPQVPFDPELAAALRVIAPSISVITSVADAVAARNNPATMPNLTNAMLEREGVFRVEDVEADGPVGQPAVPLLVCVPRNVTVPPPCFLFAHGGGMVAGDNRTGMQDMLDTAELLQAAVVSIEYRRAPETPHPGPVEDCYAALCWVAGHAAELGIDPDRIILAGTSAGGGLMAATALISRDRGGPRAMAQLLMEPMLDDRNATVSAQQEIGRGLWDRTANQAGWSALLGDSAGGAGVSPYAAPARATDLSDLPPAFLDVGSAELFRDEVVAYASGIWRCGGSAELHVFAGGYHGFDVLAPYAAVSRDERTARNGWLRRILRG